MRRMMESRRNQGCSCLLWPLGLGGDAKSNKTRDENAVYSMVQHAGGINTLCVCVMAGLVFFVNDCNQSAIAIASVTIWRPHSCDAPLRRAPSPF